jgi:hypothetical protein
MTALGMTLTMYTDLAVDTKLCLMATTSITLWMVIYIINITVIVITMGR